MAQSYDVFAKTINDKAVRVNTFLWDGVSKETLGCGTLNHKHTARRTAFALGKLISGENTPRVM